MNKITYIILILILQFQIVLSQDKCECCTYNSIDNKDLFQEFFSPDSIRVHGIQEAIIYTTEKYDNIANNYLQTKFTFNKQGFVVYRKWYNRGGKPHSLYKYNRNENNQITKITFSYLDSNEVISDFMPPEITDYYYGANNQLIKIKERDYLGNIKDDSISHYTLFEYDKNDKISRVLRHNYWEGSKDSKHSYFDERISFLTDFYSKSETYNDNKLWLKTETKYNEFGRKIFEEDFNVMLNSLAFTSNYLYDDNHKLILYKVQSGNGAGTECEDGGNFQETYSYNALGLLEKILHQYDNVNCVMKIEYK